MTWNPMLWIDLETTGLDPEEDSILEIGAIITDENLKEIASFKQVWPFSLSEYLKGFDYSPIDDAVIDMHTANNLWGLCEAVAKEGVTSLKCWGEFKHWLSENWPTSDKIILAGSGVHFDKAFLQEWELQLDFDVHYRVFDVSTLKRFFAGAGVNLPERFTESNHRAMPDVESALTLTCWSETLFRQLEFMSHGNF